VGISDIGHGAGRRYVLAIYDNGCVIVYLATPGPLSAPIRFDRQFAFSLSGPGPDSMHLVTDVHDNVFTVSLTSVEDLTGYQDWALLYGVDLEQAA
jgi:hypothetical protein